MLKQRNYELHNKHSIENSAARDCITYLTGHQKNVLHLMLYP